MSKIFRVKTKGNLYYKSSRYGFLPGLTYILFDASMSGSVGEDLDSPKSASFASKFSSKSILVGLIYLWRTRISLCKYARPVNERDAL